MRGERAEAGRRAKGAGRSGTERGGVGGEAHTPSDAGAAARGMGTNTAKGTSGGAKRQMAEGRRGGVVELGVSFTAAVVAR